MNYDHLRRWISITVILISVVLHRAIKLSDENNSPHVDNGFFSSCSLTKKALNVIC
jgi:hypothetical protein